MTGEAPATVLIERLSIDGDGIGLLDGREVRVPQVMPGERVEVRLREAREGWLEGEVVRLVVPSPHRVTPRCRHFGPCGGCAWQHMAYPEQLRAKQRLLQALLDEAMRGRAPRVRPTWPTPGPGETAGPWGYRDKVSFVFAPGDRGRPLVMGHYVRASRRVLPVEECPVHADAGNTLAFQVRDALLRAGIPGATPDGQRGIARHIVVRVAEGTGDRLATLVVTENVKPLRRVTADIVKVSGAAAGAPGARLGLHLNLHDRPDSLLFGRETRRLHGASEIRETLGGVSFLLSPTAFFQTNVRAAALMVARVLDLLPADRCRRVLDLYSGVGLFALPLARRGQLVTAVEENRDAIAAADAAVRFNRLPEGAFRPMAARVESVMGRLTPRSGDAGWDAVVLDPPRQGCPPAVLDWVFNTLGPPAVVYISCNPSALATDLQQVPTARYSVDEVQPVDMFPHTPHIETLVVLRRRRL